MTNKKKLFSIAILLVIMSGVVAAGYFLTRPPQIVTVNNYQLVNPQYKKPQLSSSTLNFASKTAPNKSQSKHSVDQLTSSVIKTDNRGFQAIVATNQLKANEYNYNPISKLFVVNRSKDKLKIPHAVVATVSPNYIYRVLQTPSDPLYSSQWHLPKISAPAAWDITTGNATNTKIADIDTGFALNHQDLSGRWVVNSGESGPTDAEGPAPNCTSRGLALDKSCNNLDDDGNGLVDDWRGWDFYDNNNTPQAGNQDPSSFYVSHGTMTSSLIGATANNDVGGVGINWTSKIMPLQVCSDDGICYYSDIISAIDYARIQGANVINLSLGGNADSLMADAIAAADSAGVSVVAAAGNDGCDCMLYPANYPSVIAVGSSNSNDSRSGFSSYGANLDVVAPGSNITTASWQPDNQTSAYGAASGTSLSTPLVTGLVSLIKSQAPATTTAQVGDFLHQGADKVAGMQGQDWTSEYGYGRINAYNTLRGLSQIHPDGTLIRSTGSPGVYLVTNSQKQPIPSLAIFTSQGYSWDRVKVATTADTALADGPAINYREGTLLKGSSPAIYVVDYLDNGTIQKRGIASWAVFTGLGYHWNEVLQVSDGELPAQDGSLVSDVTIHPDGTLIRSTGSPGVYLVTNSQKQPIPSLAIFTSQGYSWDRVKVATTADTALADGPAINYREGTLLKGSSPAIYVVDYLDNGTIQKRGIASWDIFVGLGYRWSEVLHVSDSELPTGDGDLVGL